MFPVLKFVLAVAFGAVMFALVMAFPFRRKAKKRPPARYGIDLLARRLGLEPDALRLFTPVYQKHAIDKRGPYRSDVRQKRMLHIPSGDTMALQRKILVRILHDLKVHGAVAGFEKGMSPARNASAHTRQAVILKMDLVDFFGSTKAERILEYYRGIGWDEECATILTRLTTHEGGLPQGAPTSPALSNRVNYLLDEEITKWAVYRKATYTRYADDITISFPLDYPRRVRGIEQDVRRAAKRFGYEVHKRKKLRILRRHQSQQVTGLVVNDGPRLPRKTRRWLRAVEHRMKNGGAATLTKEQLDGWRAYEADVDRVRKDAEDKLRTSIVAAMKKHRGSLTYAAQELGMPLRAFKRHMKALGLWEPPEKPAR